MVTYVLPPGIVIKVQEYIREDASNPYKQWFDGLPSQAAAKVTVAKLRMGLGNTSSIKWFDGMGEYVIDWGPATGFISPKMVTTSSCSLAAAPSGGSNVTSTKRKNC